MVNCNFSCAGAVELGLLLFHDLSSFGGVVVFLFVFGFFSPPFFYLPIHVGYSIYYSCPDCKNKLKPFPAFSIP